MLPGQEVGSGGSENKEVIASCKDKVRHLGDSLQNLAARMGAGERQAVMSQATVFGYLGFWGLGV